MQDKQLRTLLPDMLCMQLLAADAYTTFFKVAKEEERDLWQAMVEEELAHIRFASMLLTESEIPDIEFPPVRLAKFRALAASAIQFGAQSAYDRALFALKIEHAEIDYGVEALVMRMVEKSQSTPVYPGVPIEEHYSRLLTWCGRYRGATEIAMQMARIEEHVKSVPRPSPFA